MTDGIISALIAAGSTLSGILITLLSQREVRRMAWLERKVTRYSDEIRARQAEENVASKWLVELNVFDTELGAKRALRKRTFEETNLSVSVGPAEVRNP